MITGQKPDTGNLPTGRQKQRKPQYNVNCMGCKLATRHAGHDCLAKPETFQALNRINWTCDRQNEDNWGG